MRKSVSGFTIVELLIVIVIIGILAAIVIVAYSGIQARAKNDQTISAVNSWMKAMELYKTDNGTLPPNSCLGSTTTYSGDGQCWDSTYWTVQPTFLSAMSKYISKPPEPDISPYESSIPDRRGALYYLSSGVGYVYITLTGTSTCPSLSIGSNYGKSTGSNGIECYYSFQ